MRRLNLRTAAHGLRSDQAGGVIPFLAAAVPVLAVVLVGASELALVSADKTKLQDIADAVAMDAAQELAFSVDAAVVERTKANAEAQLAALKDKRPQGAITVVPTIQFNAKGDPEGMHVAITSNRKSFFGNMLPPGGFVTKVQTTALRMGKAPLCVLTHHSSYVKTLNMIDTAKLSAGKCLVHSNHEMIVEGTAGLTSEAAEVVTRASGKITPAALTGAEPITDPFAAKVFPFPSLPLCSNSGVGAKFVSGEHVLPAGKHCGKTEISGTAKVTLGPGEHYFQDAAVQIKGDAIVAGEDVVLVFDATSKLDINDRAVVNLKGRRTGSLAGFVLVSLRTNQNEFVIWSDNVNDLAGVVYVPSAQLTVQGSSKIAEQSDWTVVVARNMLIKGGVDLVINANYRGSPVPVPKGVGNKSNDKSKNARLKR
ncbi:MAG TPA: pilus assembly protein TadG-related protein [Caulobacteraceae bacterium]|jgi:Flp pilus assembly protein TadG